MNVRVYIGSGDTATAAVPHAEPVSVGPDLRDAAPTSTILENRV